MDILDKLAKSKFRSRFKLREKVHEYIKDKGLDTIYSHACDFIRDRVAPAEPVNDGKLFVADKPLKTKRKKLPHTKEESLRIKVFYFRLRRSINHSQMKQSLAQHVAEHIWRYRKNYVSQLSNIL